MKFDDFSQVEIKNVGIELAKAREVLNKSSMDFVLDLRTTKHHINAIEEGELRIFYGPPFYLDLLRRYALALNFSDSKIKQLEQRVTNQEDQDEGKGAPVSEKELLCGFPMACGCSICLESRAELVSCATLPTLRPGWLMP